VRRAVEQRPHALAPGGFSSGEVGEGRGQKFVEPVAHDLNDQQLGERLRLDRCGSVP
jgi:hypothetical protein